MAVRFRIGEFARLSGVSAKTLRYYDEIGLVRPRAVDSRTGYRYYEAEQLRTVGLVVGLRNLGMSLEEIRRLLSCAPQQRHGILTDVRETVRRSVSIGRETLRLLDDALRHASGVERTLGVVLKPAYEMRIASVRATVNTYEDIQPLETELRASVPPECAAAATGVLWHRCADSGVLEGEPFIELKKALPRRSTFDQRTLPPATTACAYADDDTDDAERAYEAIRRWIGIRRYQLAGP